MSRLPSGVVPVKAIAERLITRPRLSSLVRLWMTARRHQQHAAHPQEGQEDQRGVQSTRQAAAEQAHAHGRAAQRDDRADAAQAGARAQVNCPRQCTTPLADIIQPSVRAHGAKTGRAVRA